MDLLQSSTLTYLVIIFTFSIPLLLKFLIPTNKTNKINYSKLPPGPSPLPIIGNLLKLGNKPHHSLANLSNIHGPIMTLKLGQVTTIVISSADIAKEVLQTHDNILSNRTVPDALSVLNHDQYSLSFMRVSPRWRDLRKICNNQLFANKTLDSSQTLRQRKLQDLLDDIKKCSEIEEAVDIGRVAFMTTTNLLSNTFFSADFVHSVEEAGEYKEIVVSILKEVGAPNLSDFFPMLKIFDLQGIRRRSVISVKKVLSIFRRFVGERLKMREGTGSIGNGDVLDALLNISLDDGKIEMDKDEIEHLLMNIFVAGTDTITYTLEWAMAELMQNPEIMSKVQKELEQVVGKGIPIQETDIAKLPYMQAVIKETLRLHPSVPLLLPRKAETDVEVGDYIIPKDAQVLINAWVIGRDPNKWDNANVFVPERFLDSEVDVKGHHFELIPFGSGRRICPGLPLAIRILPMMLGSLVNCFDWKLEDGLNIDDLNKEDEYGITLEKSQPLRIVPIKLTKQ
ncbi:putative geraniol 8-hydroxylase [Medicago truncatula]|uniref:Cytochrome P450 family protein n=1 Tax=Medicago truncatula TaxID=3880 RepID=G7L8J9_MEDTR|nr:geraniol 8-hydroxylase [Medicago truncatula]AET02723.2 cytochrome P450 family protein [Medicago truncatula]RHN40558.1 putative geraniol 8-hydroxylase [Medicago truncatula]